MHVFLIWPKLPTVLGPHFDYLLQRHRTRDHSESIEAAGQMCVKHKNERKTNSASTFGVHNITTSMVLKYRVSFDCLMEELKPLQVLS